MTFEDDSDRAVPGYKNYLVYSDESGQSGKVHYGFGSLWMPWERRGDFSALVTELRNKHSYRHELKWNKVARATVPLCRDLVEEFFKRPWLMFHCLVVRKGYVDKSYHEDYDEAMRKHFAMLIRSKIAYFSSSKQKKMYHVNVDPLPSRYKKADEAAHIIINNTLKKELGLAPVHRLTTRDSKETPGIQVADLLLGGVMADWNGEELGEHKFQIKDWIAEHLGWRDLHADTRHWEWKFNIWSFHDPTQDAPRETRSWHLNLKYPVPAFRGRNRTSA